MPLAREDIMRELHHSCPVPDAGGALLDISAGGACVCTERPSSMSLRCNAAFLFFLLPDPLPPAGAPFVFPARQLGQHRELCRNGRALRLLFTHELIWPAAGMTIADIAANGSPRLRAYLKGISNTPESWHPFARWRDTPAWTAIPVDENSSAPFGRLPRHVADRPPAHAAASTPRQKQRGLPTAEAPFSTVEVRPAGFPSCLSPTCRPSAASRSKGRAAGRRRSTPGRPRPACAGA